MEWTFIQWKIWIKSQKKPSHNRNWVTLLSFPDCSKKETDQPEGDKKEGDNNKGYQKNGHQFKRKRHDGKSNQEHHNKNEQNN